MDLATRLAVGSKRFTDIARNAPFFDEGYGFDVFGLEPAYLARAATAGRTIYERYFRVSSRGIENIPDSGPTILVANHAGVLPVDGAVLCLDILHRADPPRIPRAIADQFVPRLPLVSTVFARMGVVCGTRPNVSRLLERGELIVIMPEGVTGTGKRFRDRYQIQEWRVGFAELAIRHHAAIVPVAIVGAEESWPVLHKLRTRRVFGAPYLPIPAWPIPLPARYYLRYGAPLVPAHDAEAARDRAIVGVLANEARAAVEQLIEATLAERRGVFR